MKQAIIIGLLLGSISIESVMGHRIRQEIEEDYDRPFDAELAYYDSPFGMDSQHGYGGKEQSKVENQIDVGVGSSDEGEDEGAEENAADFEPSKKDMEAAQKKFGVQVQSLAQGTQTQSKKHHKKGKNNKKAKALAEVEEGDTAEQNTQANAAAAQAAEKAKQAALKAQEEAKRLEQQAREA